MKIGKNYVSINKMSLESVQVALQKTIDKNWSRENNKLLAESCKGDIIALLSKLYVPYVAVYKYEHHRRDCTRIVMDNKNLDLWQLQQLLNMYPGTYVVYPRLSNTVRPVQKWTEKLDLCK